jgi:hypothetical protein
VDDSAITRKLPKGRNIVAILKVEVFNNTAIDE